MIKVFHVLTGIIIGGTIALVQSQIAVGLSAPEVGQIAGKVTVRIDAQYPGSGVLIKHEGNTYYVLTAKHVVGLKDQYSIVTADGDSHPIDYSTVNKINAVDLAVVQFTSNKDYTVAKIGNSDEAITGSAIYVSGWPASTEVITHPIYAFTTGHVTANASQPLELGYALGYNNETVPGMSGGPVLNEQGELVGIHGRGDETEKIQDSHLNSNIHVKTNFNFAIPIKTFLKLSPKNWGVQPSNQPITTDTKADDLYMQGEDKFRGKDYQGAIAAFTQAIQVKPKYAEAYQERGIAQFFLKNISEAISDENQAIKINPKLDQAYVFRAVILYIKNDKKGALADENQAININPKNAFAYLARGIMRYEQGDNPGAMDDYNQALSINPNLAEAYNTRGSLLYGLGKKQDAIEDFNQALRLNPDFAEVYYNRGVVRYEGKDNPGAINDYNQAIRINPNLAGAYTNRGLVSYELGDVKAAINDWQKARDINNKNPEAALAMGVALYAKGSRSEGLKLGEEAIRLDKRYGDINFLKQNFWRGSLLAQTTEFLKDPQIQALLVDPGKKPLPVKRPHHGPI